MEKENLRQLNVSEARIAERMLFNPMLEKSQIYIFDSVTESIEVYDNVSHCIKNLLTYDENDEIDNETLSSLSRIVIIPDKSSNHTYLKTGDIYDRDGNDCRSYSANMNIWSNKNMIFDLVTLGDIKQLMITETNKLRGAVVTSIIDLKEDFRFVVVFKSDMLFKSPVCGVRGVNELEYLLNNIENWLLPDNGHIEISGAPKGFYFNIDKTSVNGQDMDITNISDNIRNILGAAASEEIFVNEYNEVVDYSNFSTRVSCIVEEDDKGNTITKITLEGKTIYESVVDDGYHRIPLTPDFMQEMVEKGIYRKDPETNEYYINRDDGSRLITISITDKELVLKGPGDGKVFNASITKDSMTFLSKKISLSQSDNYYTDTFTYVDNGVIYYSDYSDNCLYYRDVFGVPYLSQ